MAQRIELDPILVEQSVFLACRDDLHLERELHVATDPLYSISDRSAREAAFRNVHLRFFERLKLGVILSELLAERRLIEDRVGRCLVREAPRQKDENAELFVKSTGIATTPADRTLIIQVCPASLIAPSRLLGRMRRELLHVSDMVDDRFGYALEEFDGLPSRQNLARERYRVLWDTYVEGRLNREGHCDEAYTARLRGIFERGVGRCSAESNPAFDRVFQAVELTHGRLLEWARQPESLLGASATPHIRVRQRPGGSCPLCGFPTHDWYEFPAAGSGSLLKSILSHHPDWHPESGACRQCAEIYDAVEPRERSGRKTREALR